MSNLYAFYHSKEWEGLMKALRIERIEADGFVHCAYCQKPIVKAYDCIGHHVKELTEENCTDAEIALNPANIWLVHHKCHNILHNKLSLANRQVYIVHGSPMAGKNSYVNEVAVAGDLIINMDSIWQCISGLNRFEKPNRLKAVAFSVRDNLLECVRLRKGKWLNAYIIGGYPYKMDRERLADALGARLIHIDTDKATCLKRLAADEQRNKEEWEKYIDDYWNELSGLY